MPRLHIVAYFFEFIRNWVAFGLGKILIFPISNSLKQAASVKSKKKKREAAAESETSVFNQSA